MQMGLHAGMANHSKSLALGLEASYDLLGVHTQLDDLQGHAPSNWALLFGHPNPFLRLHSITLEHTHNLRAKLTSDRFKCW